MKFTKEQESFIRNELGIEVREALTEKKLGDIQDAAFDVEVKETLRAGEGGLSARGEIAAQIVTLLGAHED